MTIANLSYYLVVGFILFVLVFPERALSSIGRSIDWVVERSDRVAIFMRRISEDQTKPRLVRLLARFGVWLLWALLIIPVILFIFIFLVVPLIIKLLVIIGVTNTVKM